VRQHAVIANRGAQSAERDKRQRRNENLPVRQREKDQAHNCQHMNQHKIRENAFFTVYWLPKGTFPRPNFLRCSEFHDFSADLAGLYASVPEMTPLSGKLNHTIALPSVA
jgi:hypothetical protein